MLSFASGLFAVTQCTIVVLFGPTMALSGDTPEAVTTTVRHMADSQDYIYKICAVCMASIFLSCIMLGWSSEQPVPVATINTLIYLFVFGVIVNQAIKANRMFKVDRTAAIFTGKVANGI